MAFTATLNLTFTVTGGGVTETVILPPVVLATSPGQHVQVSTVNGSGTYSPPAAALAMVIVPPTNSVVTKTLKGLAGDQGIPLNTAQYTVVQFPVSPGSFVITANGVETLDIYWL